MNKNTDKNTDNFTDIDTFRFLLEGALVGLPETELKRLQDEVYKVLQTNAQAAVDLVALMFTRGYINIADYMTLQIQLKLSASTAPKEGE